MAIEKFDCPENKGTSLKIDSDDEIVLVSILTPWKNRLQEEHIVCLDKEELQRFKQAVANL